MDTISHEVNVKFAPGCYGSAMMFDPEADECRACPFAAGCGPLAEARKLDQAAWIEKTVETRPDIARRLYRAGYRAGRVGAVGREQKRLRQAAYRSRLRPAPVEAASAISVSDREARDRVRVALVAFFDSPNLDRAWWKHRARAGELADVWLARVVANRIAKPGKAPSAATIASVEAVLTGRSEPRHRETIRRDLACLDKLSAFLAPRALPAGWGAY